MERIEQLDLENKKMIAKQIKGRGIRSARVLSAFADVPRHKFVPEKYVEEAYQDHPLPIGYGQTISQPYIVALMTSRLQLQGDEKVLEIGTGSGYQTALLAKLADHVVSIERIGILSKLAQDHLDALGITNVKLIVGDGSLGWKQGGPYDRIILTAGAPFVPEQLLEQVREGGFLMAPVGSRWRQMLEIWKKKDDAFEKKEILPVVFVPLIGKEGWQE